MNNPKISIITISFNAENCIEKTIQSVIEQSYDNIEYIIVDGGSKDGTVDIIKKYDKYITKWVSESDNGLYDAMNKGIRFATGNWICYMNCGDRFAGNNVIKDIFNTPIESNIKVVYGDTYYVSSKGKRFWKAAVVNEAISKFQPYTHQSAFFSLAKKEDLFFDNKRYRFAADYDVTCRLFKKYGENAFEYRPFVVAEYEAGTGLSIQHSDIVKNEFLKIKIRNRMNLWEIIKDVIRMVLSVFKIK